MSDVLRVETSDGVCEASIDAPPIMIEEQFLFQRLMRTPEAQERMRSFLSAGGQTAEGEHRVAALTGELP